MVTRSNGTAVFQQTAYCFPPVFLFCDGRSTEQNSKLFFYSYCIYIIIYVTGFGKIGLNAANNFFQYPRVKPYGSIFFEKFFMTEMDRHQLALAYDAVVSSGVL